VWGPLKGIFRYIVRSVVLALLLHEGGIVASPFAPPPFSSELYAGKPACLWWPTEWPCT